MSDLYSCPNCGAPIDGSGKCSYCGTVYREENHVLIQVEHPQVQVIAAEAAVDLRLMKHFVEAGKEEAYSKMTLEKLTQDLAHGLAGYMKLETMEPRGMDYQIIRGGIRVLPPDFRF